MHVLVLYMHVLTASDVDSVTLYSSLHCHTHGLLTTVTLYSSLHCHTHGLLTTVTLYSSLHCYTHGLLTTVTLYISLHCHTRGLYFACICSLPYTCTVSYMHMLTAIHTVCTEVSKLRPAGHMRLVALFNPARRAFTLTTVILYIYI